VLDDLPLNRVLPFEAALLKHVNDEFPEILDEMRKSGDLSNDLAKKLLTVIQNFKAQFVKG
jgi:F-type H+/Na+-transporting ATPase subunit alpha